jgi:DNA-binding winged helix-turn-helix (wHTH) protein
VDDETFIFGSFRLVPAQRVLLDDGKPLRLGSRAFDILITLVEHAGETISKERLIADAWPDTVVDDSASRVHVAALRKALGDGRAGRRYVANNPGRGYAFVAPVMREHPPPATDPPNRVSEGNNLPAPLTRIVGRDDVIVALAVQLACRRFLTVVFADRRMGMILLRIGRLVEAQRYFERIIQSPPFYQNEDRLPSWRRSDDRAMARALLARALWLRGFPERARHEAQASLAEVRDSDHQLTMCRVLLYGMGRITPMTGDFAAAETAISSIIESATSAAAPFWTTVGQFLRGKLLVERHQFAEGLAVLREAFDTCNRTGWRLSYPEFMGSFALALAGLGRLDEAHDAVCKAIEAAGGREDGQQWYVPELLRIKGEVLLRQAGDGSAAAAEDCFNQAREMAREQGALFWELRVALSLAQLLRGQGRSAEAMGILQPVYDRFTEGFATADLQTAEHLLQQLV